MARRAWGEGTINHRKDGIYEAKISLGVVDGKRIRKSIYGHSKRCVSEALRDARLRFQGADANNSLAEYLDDWLENGRENHWAMNTYRLREGIVRLHVVPHIGARRMKDISIADIKMLMRRWADERIGTAIRLKAFKTLSGALQTAYREQIIFENPCTFVAPPKHNRKKMALLSESQALRLMESTEPIWLQAMLTVAIMTALRQGELFALRWENIDLELQTIEVTATVVDNELYLPVEGPPKTKASQRKIALPRRAQAVLAEHRIDQQSAGYEGPYVFPNGSGGLLRRSNFMRGTFKPALKRLGLPMVTFHSLRHLANSIAIKEGANALDIANRNGQTDTRMVFDIYGHLLKGADNKVSIAMDAAFDRHSEF